MKLEQFIEKYKPTLDGNDYVFRITKEINELEVRYVPSKSMLLIDDMCLLEIDTKKADKIITFLEEVLV